MEAPPSYMPPKKKSNVGLIVGLVIGGFVLCCILPVGLLAAGGLWGWKKVLQPLLICGTTMTVTRDAVRDYADDHDGKLPAADTWRDDIRSYYVKESQPKPDNPFKAEGANEAWGCDDGHEGKTAIVYNSDIAGKNSKDLKREDVVVFEVKQATASAAQKYEKQDFLSSPAIVSDHRGWFVAYWEGAPGFFDKRDNFVPFNVRNGR